VTGQIGAYHLRNLDGAAGRINARRRYQVAAQIDEFLARRIDVATNGISEVVHLVLR